MSDYTDDEDEIGECGTTSSSGLTLTPGFMTVVGDQQDSFLDELKQRMQIEVLKHIFFTGWLATALCEKPRRQMHQFICADEKHFLVNDNNFACGNKCVIFCQAQKI